MYVVNYEVYSNYAGTNGGYSSSILDSGEITAKTLEELYEMCTELVVSMNWTKELSNARDQARPHCFRSDSNEFNQVEFSQVYEVVDAEYPDPLQVVMESAAYKEALKEHRLAQRMNEQERKSKELSQKRQQLEQLKRELGET